MASKSRLRTRGPLVLVAAVTLILPVAPVAATPSRSTVGATYGASAAVTVDTAGIPLVTSVVQPRPKSEEEAQAVSDAQVFAENHQDDVGYPWLDPATGTLELSAASTRGRDLLGISLPMSVSPTRIRDVQSSYRQLQAISDGVTRLQAEGVPDSDLLLSTAPDYESNRVVIGVSGSSPRLFKELASRYGTSAIAVLIDPNGRPGQPAATRLDDVSPYRGGARIYGPAGWCSDSFSWLVGGAVGNAMLTAAHCAHTGGDISISQGSPVIGTVKSGSEENWSITNGGTQYYTGQSVYRGDVALIRLKSGLSSSPYIYRGSRTSGTTSKVLEATRRYSYTGETVFLGGQAGGETGLYLISTVGLSYPYFTGCGPNCWVRNIVLAGRQYVPCSIAGDSGGSVFSLVTGGVRAVGTFSGFGSTGCDIFFTDIWNSYQALPGDILLY